MKLYTLNAEGLLCYAECWIDNNKAVVHTGNVGTKGVVETINWKKTFGTEDAFETHFRQMFEAENYKEWDESNSHWIAVQFQPIEKIDLNKRHIGKRNMNFVKMTTNILNEALGWNGLGEVDGYDAGRTGNPKEEYAINLFCVVVDAFKGVEVVKAALMNAKIMGHHTKIATRDMSGETEYKLQYSEDGDMVFFE